MNLKYDQEITLRLDDEEVEYEGINLNDVKPDSFENDTEIGHEVFFFENHTIVVIRENNQIREGRKRENF